MERFGIKVDIVSSGYVKDDGTFDKEKALLLCGKFAGICYDKEGFNHLLNEPIEKTKRRIDMTLNNGHHSVYDHVFVSFNFQNLPKMLAMFLNNEHEYTTSEKSARYTPVVKNGDSVISEREVELYNKWMEIYKDKIKEKYGHVFDDRKILKLAQENARYLVSVFMPTQMAYTTSFRQINYIASWMKEYKDKADMNNPFERKLSVAMGELLNELDRLNILEKGLMENEKHRQFSLIKKDLEDTEVYYGDKVYSTLYKATFADLAQAQRHRTLDYEMQVLENKEYYVPPIIRDDKALVKEWLEDISSLKNITPQGELVLINECGTYENFILKCKERLCSAAQIEIADQTRQTLLEYAKALKANNSKKAEDIVKYTKGARCTFPDFKCTSPCGFKEGINLTRKI